MILRLLSIRKLKENLLPKGGVLAGAGPKRAIFGSVWLGTLKNETPIEESAYRGSKIGVFLNICIFIEIGLAFFVV